MSDGPTDPEPDDGGRPEEGQILSPDELDISESDHVEQLDEDRFVVSPGARVDSQSPEAQQSDRDPPPERDRAGSAPEPEPAGEQSPRADRRDPPAGELTQEQVHEWLHESFETNASRYGFDVTATFDGSVSQRRMASNDVVTIFESLMLWYAQQVDTDTPVEEVLGILLMEANVPVRYPPESLKTLVRSAGLGPDDTIADLLAAIDEDDGLKL
jgi:hypothetical protein